MECGIELRRNHHMKEHMKVYLESATQTVAAGQVVKIVSSRPLVPPITSVRPPIMFIRVSISSGLARVKTRYKKYQNWQR